MSGPFVLFLLVYNDAVHSTVFGCLICVHLLLVCSGQSMYRYKVFLTRNLSDVVVGTEPNCKSGSASNSFILCVTVQTKPLDKQYFRNE